MLSSFVVSRVNMPDESFIWMDYEDEDNIMLKLDEMMARQRRRGAEIIDQMADIAWALIRLNVPRGSGYTFDHVDRTGVMWRPGGAGGGGMHEVIAGIKAGSSRHPLYVEFGTGLYGWYGVYITPNRAPYMVFFSTLLGRVIRAKSIRGQRAQHYFYSSWRELEIYAQGRMMEIDLLD